jgi:FSR family fosmidomycin resistance protein-like MFS transporter
MNYRQKILSTVCLYHGLNDGAISVIPILFPIFKIMFDLSYTQIGIVTSGSLIIHIFAQLMIGRISDGKNFRTMLTLGILLISISMYLLTLTIEFLTLTLFIFFLRFATSFFHPIGIGWISRIFKKDRLDWAMGMQSCSADIGAFIALSTTLYITEISRLEFPLLFWSLAGAIIVLSGIILTRNIDEKHLTVKMIKEKQSIIEAFDEASLLLRRIKILVPAFMISGASWGVTVTYLPLLLDERTNLSLTHIGLIVALWIGIGAISSFFYGKINEKLGRKNVLLLSYLTIGISGILLVLYTNIIVYLIIMVILGISVFLTFPSLASYISENTHESAEGRTFGTVFTLQLVGGTILLFIGGVLSDMIGIWMPFAIMGFLSLILTFVLIINYRKNLISV